MKLKLKMFLKILVRTNKCLILVIIQLRQNIIDNPNKLVVGKMKHEARSVAIGELVRLQAKMYSLFADDNSEHKKARGVKKNVVAKINHNEYKDVLLNKNSLRHSMKRIQSKNHKI